MKVAIHQPQYLPWLGYLAKWAAADVVIFLDPVQYEKNGWQNRNRIKTASGPRWLTVPVCHAPLDTAIAAVSVDVSQPWRERHRRAIEHAYAKAPYLDTHRAGLTALYAEPWAQLAPVAAASAEWLARAVGITAPAQRASTLGIRADDATGRLVALCRAVGADTYLAGRDGGAYMDVARFTEAGISVLTQTYEHPVYAQEHGDFVPLLSGLDLLLTHGDDALGILLGGSSWSRLPATPRAT